jgi:hypothetical protein
MKKSGITPWINRQGVIYTYVFTYIRYIDRGLTLTQVAWFDFGSFNRECCNCTRCRGDITNPHICGIIHNIICCLVVPTRNLMRFTKKNETSWVWLNHRPHWNGNHPQMMAADGFVHRKTHYLYPYQLVWLHISCPIKNSHRKLAWVNQITFS